MSIIKKYFFFALFLVNCIWLPANNLYADDNEDGCCVLREWCSGEFELTGEFLYWQPTVTGLPYAVTYNNATTPIITSVQNNVSLRNVEFDARPGFRL